MIVFDALYTPEQLSKAYPAFSREFPQILSLVHALQPQNIANIPEQEKQKIAKELIEQCEQYLKNIECKSRVDVKTQLTLMIRKIISKCWLIEGNSLAMYMAELLHEVRLLL